MLASAFPNFLRLTVAEFGSLTTSQLVEKVRGLQELAFQLGLEEGPCSAFMLEDNSCTKYFRSKLQLVNC